VSVKIKLKRMGKIHAPYYRIVVADARTKRDGRAIEEIGKYHPKSEPSLIEVSSERAQYWLSVGAQPTDPVRRLLEITGDWQKFRGEPGAEGTLRTAVPKTPRSQRFAEAVGQTQGGTETAPKGRTKKAGAEAKPDGKADKAEGTAKRKPRAAKADTADQTADKAAGKAAGKADTADKAAGKAADQTADKTADQAENPAGAEAPQEAAAETAAAESGGEAVRADAAGEAPQAEAAEQAPEAEAASSGSGD
jgi:small subunit ribosomal protein S16